MNNRTLLRTGMAGTIVAAICCATPVLVVLLGLVGLSAVAGFLDYVLIPAFLVFLGITIYAWRRHRTETACCSAAGRGEGSPLGERL
jgi:mercuric ion transport protein